jgi:hypothetical protein
MRRERPKQQDEQTNQERKPPDQEKDNGKPHIDEYA